MDHIFFRKYNNIVVFGLGLAAASVVGAIIYWMYYSKEDKKKIKESVNPVKSEISSQPHKPVLVLFYSESCGACREISRDWDAASDVLRKAGLVDVLEFERTKDANMLQNIGDIKGFPDIRLYPEGFPSNNYINYSGDRSEESLIQFAYSGVAESLV